MNSNHVKASIVSCFRYKRQFPLVIFERSLKEYFFKPDILVVDKARNVIEIEVKVSIADLKNDLKKTVWKYRNKLPDLYKMPYQFYYAVPEDIKDKTLEIIKEWEKDGIINGQAGLLCVIDKQNIGFEDVIVVKKSKINNIIKKINIRDVIKMVKHQSGTLCSCAVKIAKLEKIKK